MKNKMKENYPILLGLLLSLLICIGIFCCYGNQKEISFCDEVYSYTIIDVHGVHLAVRDNKWYTAPEIDKRFSSVEGFNYPAVIEATGWDVHPPVYYLVFKTIAALFPESTSKWLGFGTNLLFFIPFIALLYLGIYRISKSWWMALGFTVLFGIHPGVQGCALLIRMYMLLALCFLAFFFQTWRLWERPEKKLIYAGLGLTVFLGFMTQYYFSVYVVLFSILWGADQLLQGNWRCFLEYFGAMAAAVAVSVLAFPKWIEHIFFGYRGEASFDTLSSWGNFLEELQEAFTTVGEFVFPGHGYLYWILLILMAVLFFTIRNPEMRKTKKFFAMHLAAQIGYYCVIAHVMPTVESRYYWSVILVQGVLLLCMTAYVLKAYGLHEKKQTMAIVLAGAALFMATAAGRAELVPYSGVNYREGRLVVEDYSETPWIYYGEHNWQMHCTAFDFLIPEQIQFVTDLQNFVYDETIEKCSKVVLYAQSEEEVLALAERIREVSGRKAALQKLAERSYNEAYLLEFAE